MALVSEIVQHLGLAVENDHLVIQSLESSPIVSSPTFKLVFGLNPSRLPEVCSSLEVSELHEDRFLDVLGLLGVVNLFAGSYLVAILSRMRVGEMYGHKIYRLLKVLFVPLKSRDAALAALKRARRDRTRTNERRDSLKEIDNKAQRVQRASFGKAVSESFGGFTNRFRGASQVLSAHISLLRKPLSQPDGKIVGRAPSPVPESHPERTPKSTAPATAPTSGEESLEDAQSTQSGLSMNPESPGRNNEPGSDDDVSPIVLISPNYVTKIKFCGKLDARVISELTSLLEGRIFFFSYTFDVTRSLQNKHANTIDGPLWQRVDRRFWWNEEMQNLFVMAKILFLELDNYILPIMEGFVAIEKCQMEGYDFDYILISRRSKERSSVRFQRRGLDSEGHVSNFVETEQIVSLSLLGRRHDASYVQIRGSIPLFWSQLPQRIELKPLPVVNGDRGETETAMRKHFEDLRERYGDAVVLNLVETEGKETVVGRPFAEYMARLNLPGVAYLEWDFHSNCRGSDYRNLQRLREILAPEMEGKMESVENSPVVDLSRIWSVIARDMLNTILFRLGLQLNPEGGIKHYSDFDAVYCDIWANMGDCISISSTGTAALKGDYTRSGKRHFLGLIQDASNSVTRLYYSTFRDPTRQAVLDYVLGETTDSGALKRVLVAQKEDEVDDSTEVS
ncbi:hypothetical protein HDU93_002475 [Gonapodya sp. JEL0774]|nr:hypothetical protein HDU93_002475 [Gonapodya sp. JEL0774]